MISNNWKILLGLVGIVFTVYVLLDMPFLFDDNSNEVSSTHVLFPNAVADELIEVDHHFISKSFVGDAAKKDQSFILTDTYIDLGSCEFCIRVQYTPGSEGVAGFSYMDENGADLTNAKRITFYAMNVSGDAKVKFLVGGKEGTSENSVFKNLKFAKSTKSFKLDNDWQFIEIDLREKDLKDITNPFAVEITPANKSDQNVFFIKSIFIDTQEPKNPIETEDEV
jgi:hypothetical protein